MTRIRKITGYPKWAILSTPGSDIVAGMLVDNFGDPRVQELGSRHTIQTHKQRRNQICKQAVIHMHRYSDLSGFNLGHGLMQPDMPNHLEFDNGGAHRSLYHVIRFRVRTIGLRS